MNYIPTALLALALSPSITLAEKLVVTGSSGNQIVLDRLWDRGCLPGTGGNNWTSYQRVLVGLELTTTLTDFQNESPEPDCKNGKVGHATYTQALTLDNVEVPITWVDFEGNPADAPAGLEGVSVANGVTGLITVAEVVPAVQTRADQLNAAAFCGSTNWQIGKSIPSEDVIMCFTGGYNPGKGTIIVDDREMPWKIYDGLSDNPTQYPTEMPNYAPHLGPFTP